MSLGITELVLIVLVIFVIFGAGRLPTVMQDVGRGIRQFRQGLQEDTAITKKDGDEES